ncbi:UDP-Glycosyltransferase/glycogen phosphorylase [Linderina pennispora]|uniref:Alpha-1,3/1,6-mannosyltransferase ALG2 n=1 Tax=Linderina pennispora TaxID=61395 RepID=A0A1Y1W1S7_9FUNG|nr:UDP-Glycosyltransferase/glycogen phosphorylase [Linderina pennispora]ORX67074.1 UDP-Glycosyltransferase/glycogen phosphorylase [Linderina pennispora]
MAQKLNVAFVHPDLGIGGAERLVVDAALALQQRGHTVTIYTMHHDPAHCFAETRDGTLDVRVGGNWPIPPSLFGGLHIFCTILRSLFLARTIISDPVQYDVLFVDQLSAPIPLLKYAQAHIFFYCHFPDKLQAKRDSVGRRIYRWGFDLLEELTTGEADEIVVNSRFTQETFRKAFPRLAKVPRVLMPALNLKAYDTPVDLEDPALLALRTEKAMVVSINRFERKKDVQLAIDAFTNARGQINDKELCLVVAGGWDPKVAENTEHLKELEAHAKSLGLRTRTPADPEQLADADVLFLPSFTENQRAFLLSTALCILYTPSNEHLGIVPLEAMYMRVPVVAVNSGGPRETVLHGKTGYLCEPDQQEFAKAIVKIIGMSNDKRRAMGELGHARVKDGFGLDAFGSKLEGMFSDMRKRPLYASWVLGGILILFIVSVASFTLFLCW